MDLITATVSAHQTVSVCVCVTELCNTNTAFQVCALVSGDAHKHTSLLNRVIVATIKVVFTVVEAC